MKSKNCPSCGAKNATFATACVSCGQLFPFLITISIPRGARIFLSILILVIAIPVLWAGVVGTTTFSSVLFGLGIVGIASFAGTLAPLVLFGGKRYEFYESSFKVNGGADIPYSDISKIECDGAKLRVSLKGTGKRMIVPRNSSMGLHDSLYTWLEGKTVVSS